MPTPTKTIWPIEPHTLAKHEILRRYLGAWFGIMGQTNPKIVYLDGFAGPGCYAEGQEGSPIIALRSALDHHKNQTIQNATFVFVEADGERVQQLRDEINKHFPSIPPCFNILIKQNEFDDTLDHLLNQLDSQGQKLDPTFAFIDPFGFAGAPFQLVQRLLSNPKTEVFINIMVEPINRFIGHPDPHIVNQIVALFGTNQVCQVIKSENNRVRKLIELYQAQLSKYAAFVRYFEMRDKNNRPIYCLFFASNNRLGHVKMKEAFWKVDSNFGFSFSDATNPNQMVLFKDEVAPRLADELVGHFSGRQVLTEEIIHDYVEDQTAYTSKHAKEALTILENSKRIMVDPKKNDGRPRRRGTFPDQVVVTF